MPRKILFLAPLLLPLLVARCSTRDASSGSPADDGATDVTSLEAMEAMAFDVVVAQDSATDAGPVDDASDDAPTDATVEADAQAVGDAGRDDGDATTPEAGAPCAADGTCPVDQQCFYAVDAGCDAGPTSGRCEIVIGGSCKAGLACGCTGHNVLWCGSSSEVYRYPEPVESGGLCPEGGTTDGGGGDAGKHGRRLRR